MALDARVERLLTKALGDGPVASALYSLLVALAASGQDASGNLAVAGNATVGGTFVVTGGVTCSSTLHVVGAVTLDAALGVAGLTTLTGGLTVTTANITVTDVNFVFSTGTGTKLGTGPTQKLGAYGVPPVAQPSAFTQTYATATKTHANPTAAALTVTDGAGTNDGTIGAITGDASVIAAVQEIAAQVNKLVTDLANVKGVLNSVIDDLQAEGWCA